MTEERRSPKLSAEMPWFQRHAVHDGRESAELLATTKALFIIFILEKCHLLDPVFIVLLHFTLL